MLKLKLILIPMMVLAASCSHKGSQPNYEPGVDPEVTPAPGEAPLELPKGTHMTMNEYLSTVALPKITDSKIVNKCFLDTRHATTKERAPGHLSFQFEIKLAKREESVVVTQVILSSSENLPEWTKPCITRNYKNLIFPSFPDPVVSSTSAFGTFNMSWKKPD